MHAKTIKRLSLVAYFMSKMQMDAIFPTFYIDVLLMKLDSVSLVELRHYGLSGAPDCILFYGGWCGRKIRKSKAYRYIYTYLLFI